MMKKKVNLVHYPKSAGRTAEASLAPHFKNHLRLNGNPLVPLKGNNNRNVLIYQWLKALFSFFRYKDILITGHYVFYFRNALNVLVVRDPAGVFESSFNFFSSKNPENCKISDIDLYIDNFRFGNYAKLIKYRWDYVIFYDSFNEDMLNLGEMLGIEDLVLRTKNVTRKKPYEITDDVRKYLAEDMASYKKLMQKYKSVE